MKFNLRENYKNEEKPNNLVWKKDINGSCNSEQNEEFAIFNENCDDDLLIKSKKDLLNFQDEHKNKIKDCNIKLEELKNSKSSIGKLTSIVYSNETDKKINKIEENLKNIENQSCVVKYLKMTRQLYKTSPEEGYLKYYKDSENNKKKRELNEQSIYDIIKENTNKDIKFDYIDYFHNFNDAENNVYNFVLAEEEDRIRGMFSFKSKKYNLFIKRVNKKFKGSFHHSSLFDGKPIICAGNLYFKYGSLISIDNASGHYHPSFNSLKLFMNILKENNINNVQYNLQVIERETLINDIIKEHIEKHNEEITKPILEEINSFEFLSLSEYKKKLIVNALLYHKPTEILKTLFNKKNSFIYSGNELFDNGYYNEKLQFFELDTKLSEIDKKKYINLYQKKWQLPNCEKPIKIDSSDILLKTLNDTKISEINRDFERLKANLLIELFVDYVEDKNIDLKMIKHSLSTAVTSEILKYSIRGKFSNLPLSASFVVNESPKRIRINLNTELNKITVLWYNEGEEEDSNIKVQYTSIQDPTTLNAVNIPYIRYSLFYTNENITKIEIEEIEEIEEIKEKNIENLFNRIKNLII